MTERLRIVLQARMGSTRLPGKVLLPIRGLPIVALAAARATRSGHDLIVATTEAVSDDTLVSALESFGMAYVRGSETDVLGRFVLATQDMSDHETCIRLTADNVIPDSSFIDQLVEIRKKSNTDYVSSGDFQNPALPHGLSAEVFSVGLLRACEKLATDTYSREHVTPFMRKNRSQKPLIQFPGATEEMSSIRCTVDTFEDYKRVSSLFDRSLDSIATSWQELLTPQKAV